MMKENHANNSLLAVDVQRLTKVYEKYFDDSR